LNPSLIENTEAKIKSEKQRKTWREVKQKQRAKKKQVL
jgi:hypothetical protein